MSSLVFLGSGNFLAPGRYWNSFVIDGRVLVETSPTVLPHLRKAGVGVEDLDCIAISHFHPDHTFGWPFLLLEIAERGRDRPLYVIGPPGVRAWLRSMMELGSVLDIDARAHGELDIRYVEADPSAHRQEAGTVHIRAVEVEHVPELRCFGYLFDAGGRPVGYSGDTHPCEGLEELAAGAGSGTLVLECNGLHRSRSHMDLEAVASLRARHSSTNFVLSHLGDGVAAAWAAMDPGGGGDGVGSVTIAEDFQTLEV